MRTEKIVPRWAIRVAGALALVCVPTVALAAWTPWVSEEDGDATCGWGEAAYGFRCSGDYCDSVSLNCRSAGAGFAFGYHYWSRYFSEEPGPGLWGGLQTMYSCSTSAGLGVVTGITCDGDYCDNISVQCATPVMVAPQGITELTMGSCTWSGWYSEEAPSSVTFNGFIAAVQCGGDYCDNKRFYVCAAMNAP